MGRLRRDPSSERGLLLWIVADTLRLAAVNGVKLAEARLDAEPLDRRASLPTFRLVLEYDGTDFAGWQSQAAGTRTVQGVLEQAIERVTGIAAPVVGAGRTDAGVHAEGQVASVRVETRLDPATLGRALNALLPGDLAVRAVAEAEPGFHAIRDARRKLYLYRVWNGAVRSPLRERRQHWVRAPLDLAAMARAAAPLEGRHDFASFETRARERPEDGAAEHRPDAVPGGGRGPARRRGSTGLRGRRLPPLHGPHAGGIAARRSAGGSGPPRIWRGSWVCGTGARRDPPLRPGASPWSGWTPATVRISERFPGLPA